MKRLVSSIFLTGCLWAIANLSTYPQRYQSVAQVSHSKFKLQNALTLWHRGSTLLPTPHSLSSSQTPMNASTRKLH
ncbi:MAG TPA: hypothetical protein V6D14_01025 [Coleofasciculaceae cyanobacterium]